jgi:thiamine-phosphate pyrophosphorylase
VSGTLRGLYVITPLGLAGSADLASQVQQALLGGASCVQYRDKSTDRDRRRNEAETLARFCRKAKVPFIVNDDPELAAAVEADGVHLGQEDRDIGQARRLLGHRALIGISCYNRLDLARAAQKAGADYVAFGRFFPSASKPYAVEASPQLLTAARAEIRLPLVAIGGITPENGAALVRAGADMLAVIHGVFGQPDVRRAARAYASCFDPEEASRP